MNRSIQYNCVAVCFVYGKINNELWVASNSQDIKKLDIIRLSRILRKDGFDYPPYAIRIVKNGCKNSRHAEIQLLTALRIWFGDTIGSRDIYIGVSKPCCRNCAFMLDAYAVNYGQYHFDRVKNWELPSDLFD
ncbi:MAG: hypothetical protein J6Y82_09175 [Bacteroidales bacterium]|nr:hypothetical protein [Bacteroidales bacterium]